MADLSNIKGFESIMLQAKEIYTYDEVKRLLEEATSKTVSLMKDTNALFRISFVKRDNDLYDCVFANIQVKEKTETEDEMFEHFAKFAATCNEILKRRGMSHRWKDVGLNR